MYCHEQRRWKTVDFLIWLPYLYLQDGSVAAEDHRHKNYEEIKARQSTWISTRLKPLRSACSPQRLSRRAVSESREMHLTDHAIARHARAQKHHAIIPFLCKGYGELFYSCSFDWLYSGVTKKLKFKILCRGKFDEPSEGVRWVIVDVAGIF